MTVPADFLNIAHRGARSLAPENTLAAAEQGLAAGANLWELDVATTADGELLVIHDDTLERTSNVQSVFPDRKPWNVQDFTLDEVRRLDFGSWFNAQDPFGQIAAGAIPTEAQAGFVGIQAPTLQEALEFTRDRDWRVNVEIKDQSGTPGDELIVAKVVEQIEALDMVERVLISSFNHDYLRQVKATNLQIRTAALVDRPHPDPVGLLAQLGAAAYNPGLRHLDLAQVQEVRAAGYDVYVWTVNDEADMRRLIEAGVSGIFTDFPQALEAILQR